MADEPSAAARMFVIGLPLGIAALGVAMLLNGADTNDDLASAPITQAVESHRRGKGELAPVIELEGERHVCSGNHISVIGQDVRYDPNDPSNCALASQVGAMQLRNWFGIGFGVAAILFAGWLGFRTAGRDSGQAQAPRRRR